MGGYTLRKLSHLFVQPCRCGAEPLRDGAYEKVRTVFRSGSERDRRSDAQRRADNRGGFGHGYGADRILPACADDIGSGIGSACRSGERNTHKKDTQKHNRKTKRPFEEMLHMRAHPRKGVFLWLLGKHVAKAVGHLHTSVRQYPHDFNVV